MLHKPKYKVFAGLLSKRDRVGEIKRANRIGFALLNLII